MKHQPQFADHSEKFPYYYANQKPGLSKGCKRAIWFLLMIMIFIAGGLILANADAIDVWMNQ